jgi:hypothetical protein
VTGRASVFADDEVIRLATNEFVAVAGDDWYQRRRDDAEGRFWRKVADQGPRKGAGGSTRQGIYCFTADGKLLAYRNHHDPAVMRQELTRALSAFARLPGESRKPGAAGVEDAGKPDPRYHREPPKGAAVVTVYTRILDRDGDGFCRGTCSRPGGDFAARDHLWVLESECKVLAAQPRKGAVVPVPPALRDRLLRFHLVDNTRGEPPHWQPEDVRSQKLTLTVAEVTGAEVRLRLEGTALLATAADTAKAGRGYDVALRGDIRLDRRTGRLTRFDVTAVGDHWGQGPYTGGARSGRAPLGVAFELAKGDEADRVPPQGARNLGEYVGRR